MSKEFPKWPDSLPPPLSIGKGVKHHFKSPDDFDNESEFIKLRHDMYWFTDDRYFVYCKEGEGLGVEFIKGIKGVGIDIGELLNYFYPHPNPCHENDYVHLPPDKRMYDWHMEAAKKQMYTRFSLYLAPWKRKELDMSYAAKATSDLLNAQEPIFEAKPGFGGFSVNLIAWWRRIVGK